MLSGPNSNNAIRRATDPVIRKGDMVQIKLGVRIDGYSPNMTFQVDTFLAAADFGLRWENGLHVTEDGCEILSRYKSELIELN